MVHAYRGYKYCFSIQGPKKGLHHWRGVFPVWKGYASSTAGESDALDTSRSQADHPMLVGAVVD